MNEFINRRLSELDPKYKELSNAGIGAQTMVNIRHGKVRGLQNSTKQKLAQLLKCSQGEINTAIANTVQMTRDGELIIRNGSEPSVTETADSREQLVKTECPGLNEPEETKTGSDKLFDGTDFNCIDYREELRSLCLKKLAQLSPGEGSLTEVYASIGYALVRRLVENDAGN